MNEKYVSRAALLAALLWALVVVLVLAVWAAGIFQFPDRYGRALAVTSILAMSVAVTYQVRLYVLRVCALIRVTSGLESPDAELHSIRRA